MKRGVVVRLVCPVESVNDGSPSATLSNGDIVKGDVIVAADGMSWEHGPFPGIGTDLGITLSSAHINGSSLVIELSLGINSPIRRTFYPEKRQLFNGIDDCLMSCSGSSLTPSTPLIPTGDPQAA